MEIPYQQVPKEVLRALVEDFVTREGTDYGLQTHSLDEKVEQVLAQLATGAAVITFNPEDESFTIQASRSV